MLACKAPTFVNSIRPVRAVAVGILSILGLAPLLTRADAQTFPSKPIKIIVGAPAGTGPDVEVRQLVPQFSAELGQPVVVENKPGVAGLLGAELAAKAEPDGYTLLGATISNAAGHPRLYDRPTFNVEKDLVPVSLSIRHPWLLYVRGSLPAATFKDFVELAKSKPDSLTFASNGIGGTQHLSLELLQIMTGIKLKHIPYGNTPWQNDLVAGQVDASTWPLITLTEHLQSGKIRPGDFQRGQAVGAGTRSTAVCRCGIARLRHDGLGWALGTSRHAERHRRQTR